MLKNVTFAVASRQNIKDLLELCNQSLFLNGSGTRLRWTSSPVFLDLKRVMMPSLSSSTDSPRLLTFCLSRRRSLLVSWQTYMFPELFPSTYSVGDQFRSWQHFHLQVWDSFQE